MGIEKKDLKGQALGNFIVGLIFGLVCIFLSQDHRLEHGDGYFIIGICITGLSLSQLVIVITSDESDNKK